jgi:hypothetical protein
MFYYRIAMLVDGDLQDAIWGRPALRTARRQSVEHLVGVHLMGVALGNIRLAGHTILDIKLTTTIIYIAAMQLSESFNNIIFGSENNLSRRMV